MFVSIIIFIAFFVVIPVLTGKLFFADQGPTPKALICFGLSWVLGAIVLSAPTELVKPMTYEQFKAQSERRIEWWSNHLYNRYMRRVNDPFECQAYIHEGSFNVLEEGDLDEIAGIKNLCVFDNNDKSLYRTVKQSKHKNVFLLGHGVQDRAGEDTFAEGLYYNDFRRIARETGKQITILSCRGSELRNNLYFKYKFKTFQLHKLDELRVESRLPHLEDGLWVYGESGYLTGADLKAQYRGWRQQMSMIK